LLLNKGGYMRSLRISLAVIIMGLTATLQAKGPTVRLTLSGAALPAPVEITDAQLLSTSNVFEGSFLGARSNEPPLSTPRYRVWFHVESPAWMKRPVEVKYVVIYAKDPQTGGGLIYLPGRNEEGYHLNVGTILRDSRDGVWQSASPQWAKAVNRYLPR
jgi:hypothetical protein